jgi:ribosomal protein S27AE
MEQAVLVAGSTILLAAAWLLANRRHVRRRAGKGSDWDGTGERPELWTSSARCPRCGSRGGLLALHGDEVEFECLTCGDRHARQTRA